MRKLLVWWLVAGAVLGFRVSYLAGKGSWKGLTCFQTHSIRIPHNTPKVI